MADTETKEAKAELLVELYSEEIPWRLQEPMAENLEKFLQEELAKALGLKNAGDVFGKKNVYWTPRRVAVGIADVPVRSEAWEEERKGPKVSSPRVAIDGFLRANGLSLEKCQQKEGYLTFVVKHAAVATSDLLGEVIVRVIERMAKELPVSMRFGAQSFRWVRPLRHIMVVFAGEGVKGTLELGHEEKLTFTSETRGHPFAAPDALVVTGIQDYEDKLRKNYVEPSYQKRFDKISKKVVIDSIYDSQKIFLERHPLQEENACLTEFPVVLKGHFDEEFMTLPSSLIDAVFIDHQKMIRAYGFDSSENEFFIITNTPHVLKKQEENIIKGFERVVRARLADAKFMLERDQQIPIEELIARLQSITFHPKLGTIADKSQRIKQLFPIIVEELKSHECRYTFEKSYDSTYLQKKVDILKMSLATETVREFPSLEQEMTFILTKNHLRISSHEDEIIDAADNIDTLVSLWFAGEKPTGSGDPFALRRHALAVIKNFGKKSFFEKTSMPLKNIFGSTLEILSTQHVDDSPFYGESRELLLKEIVNFMLERLRVYIKNHEQLPHDCIQAVLTHYDAQECNINLLYDHTIELAKEIDNNNPLAEIFYRLHAIIRSAPIAPSSLASPPSPDLFSAAEEKNLHARTHQLLAESTWQKLTFQEKLQTLGKLKDAVDPFFDHVLVIDKHENIRQNRLRLLYSIYKRFLELADFTKIHHKDKQQKDKQQKHPQQKQP